MERDEEKVSKREEKREEMIRIKLTLKNQEPRLDEGVFLRKGARKARQKWRGSGLKILTSNNGEEGEN